MMATYNDFEKLISHNIPTDSTVTSVKLMVARGSTFIRVHHTITDEYREENELVYSKRILEIRIIKGEQDNGLPISSFADHS